jgi:hypothetical protein
LQVTDPGVTVPLDPIVDDVCPYAFGRFREVHKHHFASTIMDGLGKLFDEDLESMDAHARSQYQEHVWPE